MANSTPQKPRRNPPRRFFQRCDNCRLEAHALTTLLDGRKVCINCRVNMTGQDLEYHQATISPDI